MAATLVDSFKILKSAGPTLTKLQSRQVSTNQQSRQVSTNQPKKQIVKAELLDPIHHNEPTIQMRTAIPGKVLFVSVLVFIEIIDQDRSPWPSRRS